MMQLRPYQQTLVSQLNDYWQQKPQGKILAVLATGGGKCLGKGTPVLMYDGSIKPVEDIVQGELLMGPDSKPRRVLSLARGREKMYRVTPVKGDPYVVNESHILSLKRTNTGKDDRAGEIENISVRDYLNKGKHWKHLYKGWRAPVDWEEKDFDPILPPYMLGLWLGDGNSNAAAITTADDEIVEYIHSYASETGHRVRKYHNRPDNKAWTYCLPRDGKHTGSMLSALRKYNLYLNKHIPDVYKTTSRRVREQVLAGLLDSDGYLSNGYFEVTLKVKQLADDLTFIARSLGFACYMKPCKKSCQNGFTGDYWRMTISGDFSGLPFVRNRHKDNVAERKQKKSVLVTGIKVEPLEVDDYYGFEIDGDRLFMLGDFTVTHNTVIFSSIIAAEQGATCAIAHRQELVSQMSLTLAKNGIYHRIVGSNKTVKNCVKIHMDELGKTFYDAGSKHAVASVDTIIRRGEQLANWLPSVRLWVIDEAHHVLKDNKWGKAVQMFPNARGLGVTATPCRADGNGLGSHADGVFDTMFEGVAMGELIRDGYLTDYKIFAPPSSFSREQIKVSESTGDFNLNQMREVVNGSSLVAHDEKTITGDVVAQYLKIARGKSGVTFTVDVASAEEIAEQYNKAGVPAAAISCNTPDLERFAAVRKFKNKEILQLVNSEILTEGFDCPGIEVVSFGRPTESYSMYSQMFGRALRPLPGKTHAIIIDHVGNVMRHGLPDAPREWSLDRRERRTGKSEPSTVRVCTACAAVYERFRDACPDCGEPVPKPAQRSGPEFVDGDLYELDPDVLAQMRNEVVGARETPEAMRDRLTALNVPVPGVMSNVKRQRERLDALVKLDLKLAEWAGYRRAEGLSDSEIFRKFYLTYGMSWLEAQALKAADADKLRERIGL